MNPIIIVGAGISGLYAASLLTKSGIPYRVLEVRDRIGGRVLTAKDEAFGAFDLGPTWFWPHYETVIVKLIEELGIATFDQYVEGEMLFEHTPGGQATRHVVPQSYESRAVRVVGGMETIVEAVHATLPEGVVELNTKVTGITRETNGMVTVEFERAGGQVESVVASHVILALPPRLLLENIAFSPELSGSFRSKLGSLATWMGGQAKVVAVYEKPFWRENGLSGFVSSRVGPLQEIHDASPAAGSGALFGFFGMTAEQRHMAGPNELKAWLLEQLVGLFGEEARAPQAFFLQDWSSEQWTASREDWEPLRDFPDYGPVQEDAWGDILHFAGTEFSAQFGGHVEGALRAAERAVMDVLKRSPGNIS